MHVLMPATAAPAAQILAEELEERGHPVHRCHESDDTGIGCSVLRGRECPIEQWPIDMVVAVRESSSGDSGPLDDGIVCAIRTRLPLIVGGATAGNPFRAWSVEVPGRVTVDKVTEVAARPLAVHSQVATEALREYLGEVATPEDRVDVHRRGGGLLARVVVPGHLDPRARDMAAVRVTKAIREWDRFSPVLDVTFAPED